MKKPEKLLLSVLAVALLAVCFGHAGSAFAQNGGPTDASATVTLLEGIDSARSQPGHQYRAVLDKPISVSGISVPRGTPAIVVLTQARAGNAAIWTLQLTGFVVGGAPVAVNGTSPTLPRSFGNVLGAVNSAGRATAAGLRVFLQPEQVVTFALGTPMGGGAMTTQAAPQGSSPMVQEQSGIRLELTGCTKEGTRVDCEFFATNVTANDFNLGFCGGNGGNFHGSSMVDQIGNRLLDPAWTLGSTNGYSGSRQLMLPGVRTPLSFVFQPVDSRATSLLRLDLAYSNIPHQSCQNDFLFSGIPLPDHVVSAAPPAPVTDSSYNAVRPATANPSSSMQVRGQVGYTLQGCFNEGINIACTIGATALVANPRHVTWDNTNSYIVDSSGNKRMISQLHFGEDPTADAVLMQGQAIPLRLVFANASGATSLARLELVGNDGSAFSVRWTNVPVQQEQPPVSSTAPSQQSYAPSKVSAITAPQREESLPPAKPGDPAGFEVLGVRLGMPARQVLDILQRRLGVVAQKPLDYESKLPLTYYNDSYSDQPNVQYTKIIHLHDDKNGMDITFCFLPPTPLHPSSKKEFLNYISYTKDTKTPADTDEFHRELVDHYGKPRFVTDDKELRSLTAPEKLSKDPYFTYFIHHADMAYNWVDLGAGTFFHATRVNPVMVWCKASKINTATNSTVANCPYPIMITTVDSTFVLYDLDDYFRYWDDRRRMDDDANKKVTIKKSTF